MAYFNGTEFKASVAGKNIAKTRDLNVDISVATIDVSNRDSLGWKEIIGGQKSWKASITGVVDYVEGASESGVKTLKTLALLRTAVAIEMGNETTGSQNYTGNGIITNCSTSAPYEGEVEYTLEIEGSGAIVLSTAS
ncbi:phage tail tube protein [Pedobacter sp.]|uniref:phage tail tube protein n=1 Tax=Pedobacter sp. TaxID=1411316 RepID=UPI003C3EFC94